MTFSAPRIKSREFLQFFFRRREDHLVHLEKKKKRKKKGAHPRRGKTRTNLTGFSSQFYRVFLLFFCFVFFFGFLGCRGCFLFRFVMSCMRAMIGISRGRDTGD